MRECFPDTESGEIKPYIEKPKNPTSFNFKGRQKPAFDYDDSGNASRYFKSIIYEPKTGKRERNRGCRGFEEKKADKRSDVATGMWKDKNAPHRNHHPTVKPIKLMQYLIKMVSRKGAVILDPFLGSGSTCIGAYLENRYFLGIERDKDYLEIAKKRIESYRMQTRLF